MMISYKKQLCTTVDRKCPTSKFVTIEIHKIVIGIKNIAKLIWIGNFQKQFFLSSILPRNEVNKKSLPNPASRMDTIKKMALFYVKQLVI